MQQMEKIMTGSKTLRNVLLATAAMVISTSAASAAI